MATKFVTYENTDRFIDSTTGEITSKSETKTIRLTTSGEKFFKFFVDSIGNLYGLSTASSFKVLFAILQMATTRDNAVNLRYGMKGHICQIIGIHINSFSKSLSELVNKEILKKTDSKDYYRLNPYIFGQGSFIDIEKLRQSIEFEFDFKKGEFKRKISADSITSTGMDILQNPHKYEVAEAVKKESENDSNISISVQHKNNKGITPYPSEPPLLAFDDKITSNDDGENNDNNGKIDKDKEKMEYDKMMKSFELTSKMLDRIKDLESSGRKDEAMAFQKTMEQYLNSFGANR